MLRIRPFPAFRPQPDQAARVASVPYDVVTTAEARALAEGHPESFLHVIRPEIDLPDNVPANDPAVYEAGRRQLETLLAGGILIREPEPRLYLYRQVMCHRVQIGIVCCCHIDDYASGVIKRHENTRPDKEDDRTRHVLTLDANTGPVFLTYRGTEEINELVGQDTNSRPLYHFNSQDGVTHTVWTVANAQRYVDALSGIECAYVADGHHRSASAARAGAQRRAANPNHHGDEEYNWFLSVLFPTEQLTILPYNRIVRSLGDRSAAATREALAAVGDLREIPRPGDGPEGEPPHPGSFHLHLDGHWHLLALDPATIDAGDPVESLDVSLLQRRVLGPVFGIGDPRTDENIGFVGGIRGHEDLERRVRDGEAAVAFGLRPTTIEQLLAVADAGLIMPPKSTWFEPKLRSGLFVHGLD